MPARRQTLLAIAALLFSGVAQPLISAPLNLYWLHPWALAPGFYVLCRLGAKRAFFAGWFMGIVANLGIFYWVAETISVFGELPYAVGLLALVLLVAFNLSHVAFNRSHVRIPCLTVPTFEFRKRCGVRTDTWA